MVALVGGVPAHTNLLDVLQAYVDHQIDVITRRSQYRLDIAEKRLYTSKVSSRPSRSHRRDHRTIRERGSLAAREALMAGITPEGGEKPSPFR